MSRTRPIARTIIAAIGATAAVAGLTSLGAASLAGVSPAPSVTRLTGSTALFTRHARAIGDAAPAQKLSIQVWLRPALAGAERFATAVSTPGNQQFHHYLRPASYAARFGASQSQATSVRKWLRSRGFTAIRADARRSYVRATASAAQIDRAFATQLTLYRPTATVSAGPYQLRANSQPLSIPGHWPAQSSASPAWTTPHRTCRSIGRTSARRLLRRGQGISRARTTMRSTRPAACRSNSARRHSRPSPAGTAGPSSARPAERTPAAPAAARQSP